jgi:hypothetical protein
LVGKDIKKVIKKLQELGFVVNEIKEKSDAYPKEGTVIKVAGAGSQKEIGSTIDVTVSDGQETVKPKTYKFMESFTKEGATSYEYILYDGNGTQIASGDGPGDTINFGEKGLSTETGKLLLKWFKEETITTPVQSDVDENGDGVVDENDQKEETTTQITELGNFEKTVKFVEEKTEE